MSDSLLDLPKQAYIGLGSNLGDRMWFLQSATAEIHRKVGDVIAVSGVVQSPASGFQGNDFLNACIEINTRLDPQRLLHVLLEIERNLGRNRGDKGGYSNRQIDLDLLLYEDQIIKTQDLLVPHPGMEKRRFVLQPLSEIASGVKHPEKGVTISELLKHAPTESLLPVEEQLRKPEFFGFSRYNYIAVEGNIGAGKTSLATMISQDFNARLILERFKDNAFLPKFYEDKGRYAFPLEMSFLADRYQQLSDDLAQYDLFKDFVISDYDVFKSLIFAKITLQEEEYALYQKLFHIMYKELVKPDLYIYLYQNTDRLLENIRKRGRGYEQKIEAQYLADINKSYFAFIKSQGNLNVKVIDISELDFVENREDYLSLLHHFN